MLAGALLVLVLALLGMKVVELRDVVVVKYLEHSLSQNRHWYIQEDFTGAERQDIEQNLKQLKEKLGIFDSA